MSVYEEDGYLKISGYKGRFALDHYNFTCPACGNRLILGTDGSTNGYIGSFHCPACGEEFMAADDASENSMLHVYNSRYGRMDLISTGMKKEDSGY